MQTSKHNKPWKQIWAMQFWGPSFFKILLGDLKNSHGLNHLPSASNAWRDPSLHHCKHSKLGWFQHFCGSSKSEILFLHVNSLRPRYATCWHGTWTTLVQPMAWSNHILAWFSECGMINWDFFWSPLGVEGMQKKLSLTTFHHWFR